MSMTWCRLWHDMPTDPKWRTIAKRSGQRIGDVIAVYNFILVNASANANERGRTHNLCAEDIGTALDLDESEVQTILSAMQGKVIDGDIVCGWEKRQPKREDGSAERAKVWRERKRTQTNAQERSDTDTDTDTDTDKDKKREKNKDLKKEVGPVGPINKTLQKPEGVPDSVWNDFVVLRKSKKSAITETAIKGIQREANKAGMALGEALTICCERGWQGFKAEWLQDKKNGNGRHGYQTREDRMLEGAKETLKEIWSREGP